VSGASSSQIVRQQSFGGEQVRLWRTTVFHHTPSVLLHPLLSDTPNALLFCDQILKTVYSHQLLKVHRF